MLVPTCAYCRRHPVVQEWQAFCSERCKLADLGHWLTGDYRVAGDPPAETDPDASSDEDL